MSTVRLLTTNDAALHVETNNFDWIIHGTQPGRVEKLIDDTVSFSAIVKETASLPGEYSLVVIESGSRTVIRAYRGITSSFDIFYCRRPTDGTIIVGDHFRNVLSELSVTNRTVSDSVAGDQLLFGTRPKGSYVDEIDRLSHGNILEWPVSGEPETKLFETLSVDDTISSSEAKRRLDRYFSNVIDERNFEGSVATMLSGGVDSTLIQTYLDTEETVSAAFNSSEFKFEIDYARRASELLDSKHNLIELDENEFCEYVETTTAATGHPLQHLQATLMYATVSETSHQVYLNGQLADGLFGAGNTTLAHLVQHIGPFIQHLPNVASEIKKLKKVDRQLRYPATDPRGLAMNFVIHADEDRVMDILNEQIVKERKNERLRYTRERVGVGEDANYADHMHLGHFIDFFQDNTVTSWRHASHAAGKTMHTPFAGRKVVETVLAVPSSKRYARFAMPSRDNHGSLIKRKYLLKELLEEKLPSYNTKKPKGSSGLPVHRYFENGPLSNVFERYSIPEFVPENKHHLIKNGSDHISWYAFSYAVWREQILENEDLDLLQGTSVIER